MEEVRARSHELETAVTTLVIELRRDREEARSERKRILGVAESAAESARALQDAVTLLRGVGQGRAAIATSLRLWIGVLFGLIGAIAAGVSITVATGGMTGPTP